MIKAAHAALVAILAAFLLCSCLTAQHEPTGAPAAPTVLKSDEFIVLTAQEGDSIRQLARTYYGAPDRDWIIQEYNNLDELRPGRTVVIPLKYDRRGGLYPDGYQLVPILVYHRFDRQCDQPLCVSANSFERQMKYLKENGFRTISLRDFYAFCRLQKTIPKKSVVITIDDGYGSVYDVAYPILKKYNFIATLFVYTDFIEASQRALSWSQLRELQDAGFEIQAHSKSHANLTVKRDTESEAQYLKRIDSELTVPRRLIRENVGVEPVFLAYPYGMTNEQVSNLAQNAGYMAAFTVTGEPNPFFTQLYSASRIQIFSSTSESDFARALTNFRKQDLL